MSKNDDVLPALAKSIDPKVVDKISDSLQSAKNITKSDYSKSLKILKEAGRDTDGIVHNTIASIVKNYKNLQCKPCADKIISYLKSNNLQGFKYEINVTPLTRGRDYIHSDTFGGNIATNGRHIGVMFDNLIFDNHHLNGISFEEWLSDLFCTHGNLWDLYKSGVLKIPPEPI